MISGVLNIYKEKGYTSADVVARLRGILRQKKIGHTGTLDPDAEGVLPVVLGQGTKLVEMLTDKTKEYICCCRLGVTTDTEDMSGRILTRSDVSISVDELKRCLAGFAGEYEQLPPMYSAIKQNGKRLYELAREGKVVERRVRLLNIYGIELLDCALPLFRFRVDCSRGTYVRSLCRDIGDKLGCGAAMESLLRSRSGEFTLESALKLDEVEVLYKSGELAAHILPVEHFYEDCCRLTTVAEAERFLQNGNAMEPHNFLNAPVLSDGELCRIYDFNGRFCAVYRYNKAKGKYLPETMYLS